MSVIAAVLSGGHPDGEDGKRGAAVDQGEDQGKPAEGSSRSDS